MKLIKKILVVICFLLNTWLLANDFQIRSSINRDIDASVVYNSVNDEYFVVWTDSSTSSIAIMGQRVKGDGTGLIGTPFTIFSIGVYSSVAYNSQSNEYMVTASLFGVVVCQRVSNTGVMQGIPISLMSKNTSIWSKIIYNTLGNNYLVVGAALIDLGNDQSRINIYTLKVAANGQPIGTEQLIRDQGHGNFSDGAIFSVAYAPISSTETPTGRYLLAIQDPSDITMLDDNGLIVSKVNDSQHPGNIVDDHIPFQQSKIGVAHNLDVAFGSWEGQNAFMLVWGDQNNQANGFKWTGIWAGIVNATQIIFESDAGVSSTVFPVSTYYGLIHNFDNASFKSWKPVVAYNKVAGKFMISWRETPSNDPINPIKVNHIRANAVESSVIPIPPNVILSAVTGSENPMNPAIAASEKTTEALVVWDDSRNISTKDIDLFGAIFQTAGANTLTITSPNGSEMWGIGTQQNITWQSTNIGNLNVTIEYSTDYGATYNFIALQTNTDGSNTYNWTVPNTPSTQSIVKISVSGLKDESDQQFTIVEPSITIIEPDGVIWLVGSTQQILWNNYYFSDDVKIEYSTDNGSSFTTIISSTTNTGSFSWKIPNTPSIPCKVRVSDAADDYPSDVTEVFAILIAKLTLTSPNGGEYLGVGTKHNINWTSINIPDNDVSIEYSTDNGINYNLIGFHTNNQSTESFEWTIPKTPSSKCIVRISLFMQGVEIMDVSDAPFNIAQITVISPNGGEIWKSNPYNEQCSNCLPTIYLHSIDWNSSSFSGAVRIDLKGVDKNGKYFSRVLANNINSKSLVVLGIDTNIFKPGEVDFPLSVKIRVADAQKKSAAYLDNEDDKIFDWSDNDFIIIDSDKNTSTGNNVVVNFINKTAITFDNVTAEGITTVEVMPTGSPPPTGFQVFPIDLPEFYNIETTAEFSGNIELRMNYNDSSLTSTEEAKLKLFVYETSTGNWQDITTSVNIDSNYITSQVSHLSEFAIMAPTGKNVIVTNTNDNGVGSLRNAIETANTNPGADIIKFNIPKEDPNYDEAKGIWVIKPENLFSSILDSNLVIDGTSQRLFIAEDTNPEGPEIVINGSLGVSNGFNIYAKRTELYELTINNFNFSGIYFYSTESCIVSGCYIGTDYTGMEAEGMNAGIAIAKSKNIRIGSSTYCDKANILSGNRFYGISVSDSSQYNFIIGNYIGLNRNLTKTVGNTDYGIDFNISSNNKIEGNFIGGNKLGVSFGSSNYNNVINNFIGTNELWNADFGNSDGIAIWRNSSSNRIVENVIGYNTRVGIRVDSVNSLQNIISRNMISKNGGLGIDNRYGGNTELAPPSIITMIDNEISGTAGANQVIELFADSLDEGQIFIDSTVSDESGNFRLSVNETFLLPINFTATARDIIGNTSEFSSPYIVTDIEDERNKILSKFILYQNYPNPFNPSTLISYQIPNRAFVKVILYDILGREVRILDSGIKESGIHEITLNAENMNSGIYFYTIRFSKFSETKKMLLMK